jgi:hypothetical protein
VFDRIAVPHEGVCVSVLGIEGVWRGIVMFGLWVTMIFMNYELWINDGFYEGGLVGDTRI